MSSNDEHEVEYIGQSSPKPIPNPIIVLPIDEQDDKSDTSYSVDSEDCVSINSQLSEMESNSSEEKNAMSSSVTLTADMNSSEDKNVMSSSVTLTADINSSDIPGDSSKMCDEKFDKSTHTEGAMSENDASNNMSAAINPNISCPVHGQLVAVNPNAIFTKDVENGESSRREAVDSAVEEELINPFYSSQNSVLSNAEDGINDDDHTVNSGHVADNEASDPHDGTISSKTTETSLPQYELRHDSTESSQGTNYTSNSKYVKHYYI